MIRHFLIKVTAYYPVLFLTSVGALSNMRKTLYKGGDVIDR
jgi:hypothetical protein